MDGVVLVLNQNYEPLNVCNLPRAFRLVFGEKAEVIEYDHQVIRTPRTEYRAPSVIRLQYQIRRPRPRVKLSRREVFARDRHTCQYCGRQSHDLTLDHIVPRHRGGGHTWENLVAACKPCNHRKGGKTARRGAAAPAPAAVRAAQRHLLAVHAVPRRRPQRGVALVPVPGSQLTGPSGRHRGRDPGRRRRPARDAPDGRSRGLRGRRLAARPDPRPAPGRLGPRHRRTPRAPRRALPGRGLREPLRDRRGPAATARPSRSRPSGPITTTPTSGGRTGSSSATPSRSTWPAATSRSTRWPGGPARATRRRSSIPYGGILDIQARVLRAVGDPRRRFEEDALRMIRAVRLAATLDFGIEAGDAGRDPGTGRARRAPVGRADRRRARQAARRARRRRSGSG